MRHSQLMQCLSSILTNGLICKRHNRRKTKGRLIGLKYFSFEIYLLTIYKSTTKVIKGMYQSSAIDKLVFFEREWAIHSLFFCKTWAICFSKRPYHSLSFSILYGPSLFQNDMDIFSIAMNPSPVVAHV